jgi:hypothetical protein
VPIKNRQQLLVIVAVSAVSLFAADKLLLGPLLKAWDVRAARIKVLRNQVSRGKMLVQRDRPIRNHWEQMQSRALTNNSSAAEQLVFNTIDGWARETGVLVNAITPQWKQDADDHATYECRVDASGDLSRLSRFLYRIERGALALRLDDVELSARDKDGQQLSLGLQLSGLMLNPPSK